MGGRNSTLWVPLPLSLSLHLPVSSRKKAVEAKCSLACEYLSEEDYMDLLWTTLSEFPGEGPAPGGAGTVQPGNVAVTSCQLEANPISKKSRGFVFKP